MIIVRKEFQSTPLFWCTHPLMQLAPCLLNLCFPPLLSDPLHFKVFQTVPPPSWNPLLPNWTQKPSICMTDEFKQISKGYFTSLTIAFYQKTNFDFLNPFGNISSYLIVYLILIYRMFSGSFCGNLEWLFSQNYGDRKKQVFFECITQFFKG